MRITPRFAFFSAVVLAHSATAASAATVTGSESGPLTVYSTRHQPEDAKVLALFTKATGIPVEAVDEDFDPLFERLSREREHGPADVILSVGAATLERCAEAGLLQPIKSDAVLHAVPADLRDKDGEWVGLTYWARVIAYQKDRFAASDLADYEALADPKFQGRVLVRSASSPYNQALVAAMLASRGSAATEVWAHGLVANLARPPQGGDTAQLQAMADGEGTISIVNTRYWARFASSDKVTEQEVVSNVGIIFPNQANRGTLVDVAGAALSRWTARPHAATMLIEFLLRPEVQKLMAGADLEYPVVAGVEAPAVLANLGAFKIDGPAIGLFGKFAPEADAVMARAGWE